MSAGQNTGMLKGAIAACLLPMTLGGVACIWNFFGFIEELKNPRMIYEEDLYVFYPIFLCFFLGTPIAASSACKRLKRLLPYERRTEWSSAVQCGWMAATKVHFIAAFFYTIVICLIYEASEGTATGYGIGVFIISSITNVVLWFGLTLPFSLFCATIFWMVTKSARPDATPDQWPEG